MIFVVWEKTNGRMRSSRRVFRTWIYFRNRRKPRLFKESVSPTRRPRTTSEWSAKGLSKRWRFAMHPSALPNRWHESVWLSIDITTYTELCYGDIYARKLSRKCPFSVGFIRVSTRSTFDPIPEERRQYLLYVYCVLYVFVCYMYIVYWDAHKPLPSNMLLEKVIDEINTSGGITLDNSRVNILADAYDLAFMRNSQAETEQLCKELIVTAEKVGLWNPTMKKTEYIIISWLEKEYQPEKFMNTSKDVCFKE